MKRIRRTAGAPVISRYQPQSGKTPGSSFLSPLGERTPGKYLLPENRATTGAVGKVPAESTNVRGGSRDPSRGAWVTPDSPDYPVASAVGSFDLDPFSSPRSHIASIHRCMLEDGGDGFGNGTPGSYRCGEDGALRHADEANSVWLQPPYLKGFVQRAFRHYRHTRWVALLRFDPRPPWWQEVYDASELVAVVEIEFEPPPGVKDMGGNSFPHALYYRRAADVTPAVLRLAAAVWRKKPRT